VKVLVTGSSGHLGEALLRVMRGGEHQAVGLDLVPGAFTDEVGSIADRAFVADAVAGCDAIVHTATLHKPHVATHTRQQFVDTNVTGTLNLLEEAVAQRCRGMVFTSTTSTFGRALAPPEGEPAAWITEDVRPVPKNIYGVTKVAAEDLCELFHGLHGLPVLVLKTSRFFPEADDSRRVRDRYDDLNAKVNELLYRRLDVADAVDAHLLALDRLEQLGFGRYILSATSPFARTDLARLRSEPDAVVAQYVDFAPEYERRGWKLFDGFERVYVNERARRDLGWQPRHTFAYAIEQLRAGASPFSALTEEVGKKGYHQGQTFGDQPFPVD